MTRVQRTVITHWRGIVTACAIVALFGISWATWSRLNDSDRLYAAAAEEANKRGDAVGTLAGDVRALREQIKSMGQTPVAEDPSKAVKDLPDRTEVPVPIPGPQGLPGTPGADGSDGANGKDGENGKDGVSGPAGPQGLTGEQGVQGPAGPTGPAGSDGTDGKDGTDGQTCPDGYSLQVPPWDVDALVCRKDPAPSPTEDPGKVPLAALIPDRRRTLVL